MKIIKIFGVVAGIHVFALIVIFANPGCTSTKPVPAPVDTVTTAQPDESPPVALPLPPTDTSPMLSTPITFDPHAPAVASTSVGGGRFEPTRPNTPTASTLVAPPVSDITPATTYTVKPGDTLWELGKKFRVPYAEIASANNIRVNAPLRTGQKLIIPTKAPTTTTAAAPAPATTTAARTQKAPAPARTGNELRHVVRPNETLSMIARTYGVRQGEIAVVNNISDPQKIRAGTELIIPGGWQSTGGNASKATPRPTTPPPTEQTPPPQPATNAPRPIINIIDADPNAPATPPSNEEVPVIQVEDNPMTSAPKSN